MSRSLEGMTDIGKGPSVSARFPREKHVAPRPIRRSAETGVGSSLLDSGENPGSQGYIWTELAANRMRSLQHRMGLVSPPSRLEVPHAHAHCTAFSGLGNRPRFVAPQPV